VSEDEAPVRHRLSFYYRTTLLEISGAGIGAGGLPALKLKTDY
jgi:hypothetical protein